jgi:D-sedoheptulose 7-phosphate isomerase
VNTSLHLTASATKQLLRDCIRDSSQVIASLESQLAAIEQIAAAVADALLGGHKLLTAGNGGSAAEAMHLAQEITGKYSRPDRRALPAICLASDGTALTCIGNDWDFAMVFARQVQAFARPNDVLLIFSSSGQSQNLIRASHAMRQAGGKVIGLLGKGGGENLRLCDLSVVVPSQRTAPIQEAHQVILHLILEYLEARCAATG